MTDNCATSKPLNAPRENQRLSAGARFYLLASITVSCLAGSSMPTPIYPIYQNEWHFSSVIITLIVNAYALSVLAALLVVGRVSDYIGRRPVLLVATVVQMLAMYFLGAADGISDLIAGRVLQGLATGAAVSAVGAGLIDISKQRGAIANAVAPISGSALGALLGSVIVQYLPFPTHTVFVLLGSVFLIQFAGMLLVRDVITFKSGALRSLIPQFAVPPHIRARMLVASAVFIGGWSLGGFYASLGPALIQNVFNLPASLIGGLALAAFSGCGVVGIVAFKSRSGATQTLIGSLGLVVGMALILISLSTNSVIVFFNGIALAGAGFGVGFQGGIHLVVESAEPHETAGVLSVAFVCCYLGMGVPAVGAGYEVGQGANIVITTQFFCAVVILLAILAMLGLGLTRKTTKG